MKSERNLEINFKKEKEKVFRIINHFEGFEIVIKS